MSSIKKITDLKNIYNFLDFKSTDISLVEQTIKEHGKDKIIEIKNCLIYAPNGSGKTNLSRFLNKISSDTSDLSNILSKEAENLDELNFSLNIDGVDIDRKNYLSQGNLLRNIYVFNSDYIDKTIRSEGFSKKIEGELEISMPIGEISSEIDKLEKENTKYNNDRNKKLINIKKEFSEKEKELKNKYNKLERNIWIEFKFENILDIEKFELKNIENDEEHFKDCEENFEKLKSFDEKDKINYSINSIKLNYISTIQESIKLLGEKKEFDIFNNEDIEKKIAYITQRWLNNRDDLEKGIKQSESIGKCLLCGRKLDEDVKTLFENYKNYFSQEKSKFQADIDGKIKNLEELEKILGELNNDLEFKIEEYTKLFDINNEYLELKIDDIIKDLSILKEKLIEKKEESEKILKIDNKLEENIKSLNKAIEDNRKIVEKINKKIDDSGSRKAILRTYIGKKNLYNFYLNNKSYFDEIVDYTLKINGNKEQIIEEKNKLPTKEILDNLIKIMNIFLKNYLGLDKYKVEKETGLIKLKLLENIDISNETNRISEGEKNMIALSYYLASSIEKYTKINEFNQVIFVIDDPVSSVSYGNFFGICNLLKNFDNTIIKILKWEDINIQKNRQKIILTHNTQFLNTLVNNVFNEKSLYFLLTPQGFKLVEYKKVISDFKMAVYRIHKKEGNVGNDLRRFFETIKHFYGLRGNFDAECLKKIFHNFEDKEHKEFFYASNYYSHLLEPFDSLGVENLDKILEQFEELIEKSVFEGLWEEVKTIG